MTFEQWWKEQGVLQEKNRAPCKLAWDIATKEERERCAKLVEESPRRGYATGDMRNLAQLIRQGVLK